MYQIETNKRLHCTCIAILIRVNVYKMSIFRYEFIIAVSCRLWRTKERVFSMILKEIKEKYFDPKREWSLDYEVIGKIMGLYTKQLVT